MPQTVENYSLRQAIERLGARWPVHCTSLPGSRVEIVMDEAEAETLLGEGRPTAEDLEEARDDAYDDGHTDGYDEGHADGESETEMKVAEDFIELLGSFHDDTPLPGALVDQLNVLARKYAASGL